MKNLREVKYIYHATLLEHEPSIKTRILIDRPDASKHLDFGKGFYTTTNLTQAEERALDLAKAAVMNIWRDPSNKRSVVSVTGIVLRFEVNQEPLFSINEEEYKIFQDKITIDWANFIANNRYTKHYFEHSYKWTYGLMADGDQLFRAVNEYKSGNMIAKKFLECIKPYKDFYDQFVFHDEELVNQVLLKPQICSRHPFTKTDKK